MDVFKIDNKIKLKRFQRASANLETGKVKVRWADCGAVAPLHLSLCWILMLPPCHPAGFVLHAPQSIH